MKKSLIVTVAVAFVLVTILLCINPNGKMYQKKKHFDSVNDVLEQLESNKIIEDFDLSGTRHETDEFKECLSKRKRLTFSQIGFDKIKIQKIENLDEDQKKSILDDYNNTQNRLEMPYKPSKIQPLRLDVEGTYLGYDEKTGKEIPEQKDFLIDLVVVDEGEGMVIDYYVQHESTDDKDKEGKINVKG